MRVAQSQFHNLYLRIHASPQSWVHFRSLLRMKGCHGRRELEVGFSLEMLSHIRIRVFCKSTIYDMKLRCQKTLDMFSRPSPKHSPLKKDGNVLWSGLSGPPPAFLIDLSDLEEQFESGGYVDY